MLTISVCSFQDSLYLPFLKIGVTLAFLQSFGMIDCFIDAWYIIVIVLNKIKATEPDEAAALKPFSWDVDLFLFLS